MNTVLKNRMQLCLLLITTTLCASLLQSCKKFVEVPAPSNTLTNKSVFEENETAIAAVTSLYSQMSSLSFSGYLAPTTSIYWGLFSDELRLYSAGSNNKLYQECYTNTLNGQSDLNYWDFLYNTIYQANSAIIGLSNSKSIDESIKKELTGEAKFIRAFCYFYLVNLYGDVPITLNIDYKESVNLEKTSASQVYLQIINDLKDAQQQLSENFLDGKLKPTTIERTRPSKWAANALLARTYLYTDDNLNAVAMATSLIESKSLFDVVPLDQVFKIESQEAVWQLQSVIPELNTKDGYYLTIPESGPNETNCFGLSDKVISAFENGDRRFTSWVGKVVISGNEEYYPAKYKAFAFGEPIVEHEVVFRLSEQYLIRAEANAKLGKLEDGLNDLNIIRMRAGLHNETQNGQEDLLAKIYKERFVELFTEWGHRWFDLKRTKRVDPIMAEYARIKGSVWSSYKQLLPIKNAELLAAPNLKQNPGYN